MRKVFNVLAVIFIIISIVFAILPMGSLAVLPVGIALVFSAIALFISEGDAKKFPKWLVILSVVLMIVVVTKAMMPDEVAQDSEFDQKKIESKNEDLKDLEELEGLE